MNKHKYSFLKLINFSSGFLLSLIYSFILTKRVKRIIFSSTNNCNFTFNSKSLFLLGKGNFEANGFDVYFVINDSIKRKYLSQLYGNYFISNKGLKNKIFILKAAVWIISTLDLPVSGVFLSQRRFVYHLGHGTPIKNIGLMEKRSSVVKKMYYKINGSNISLYLSSSLFFKGYIARAFGVKKNKVIVAPQPRIDFLLSKKSDLSNLRDNNKTKLVLYCPTWRPFSDVKLFPFESINLEDFNGFLQCNNAKILLRLHPLFEGDLSPYIKSHIVLFDSNVCPEISECLTDIDALITDYSSIYCDYFLLDKPVAFIPYDLDVYKEKIGFSFDYYELTSGCYLNNLNELECFINSVATDSFDISKQIEMKSRFNVSTNARASESNYLIINKEYNRRLLKKPSTDN